MTNYLRENLKETPQLSITKINLIITYLKLCLNLPEANELSAVHAFMNKWTSSHQIYQQETSHSCTSYSYIHMSSKRAVDNVLSSHLTVAQTWTWRRNSQHLHSVYQQHDTWLFLILISGVFTQEIQWDVLLKILTSMSVLLILYKKKRLWDEHTHVKSCGHDDIKTWECFPYYWGPIQ